MKKLSESFKSERFTDILSWVLVIGLGIGIVVWLDSLDVSKSNKYAIGKGIKWLLILVPWLGVKLYNLFTKKEGSTEDAEPVAEAVQEEQIPSEPIVEEVQQQTKPMDLPLEKPKESTWSIVVTAIIVAAIILLGSFFILSSCGSRLNEQEEHMVGYWNCVGDEEDEETDEDYRRTRTFDNTFEYRSDGTLLQTTICNERVYVEEEDYNNIITFKWEITGKGTWDIEDDVLVERVQECNIALREIRTAIKKDNDLEYVTQLKAMMEDEVPGWRNSFLGEERNRIVILTDEKFVGKSGDDEYDMVRIK